MNHRVGLALSLMLSFVPIARAGDASEPAADPVVEPATWRCLGAYWVIRGDANKNARIDVSYRKAGGSDWKPAAPLFRVARGACRDKAIKIPADGWLFAGSIIDVPEATEYELRLKLVDPDGGTAERILRAHTIAEPLAPVGGPMYHVVPGNGGGIGTQDNPFKGIAAAEQRARAGDTFLLHAGTYDGQWVVRKSGEEGRPIVWRSAGDGEAILRTDIPIGPEGYPLGHVIDCSDQHDLIFEGLSIRGQVYSDLCLQDACRVTIRRCKLDVFLYGIVGERNDSGKLGNFFIADNTIIGRQPFPATSEQWHTIGENRGIWLGGQGSTICYNRVSNCKDGIDTADCPTPTVAIDIHNNDVSNNYDDGCEMDGSHRNCRTFLNRYVNSLTGISFQPVYGGPVYAVRNVVYNARSEFLKLHNSPSGAVVVHNTFVHFGPILHVSTGEAADNCYMRNNLFIGTASPAVDFDLPMTNMDFDYDGFGGFTPDTFFLRYSKVRYASPEEVRGKSPIEKHLTVVDPATLFLSGIRAPQPAADHNPNAPGYAWTTGFTVYKSESIDLRLNPQSSAVGAAEALPGFNDGSKEHPADLGAYPVNCELPHYGPRPERTSP